MEKSRIKMSVYQAGVAVVAVLTYAVLRVGGVVTSREFYLQKVSVCDDPYGMPLGERANVASFLSCTVSCLIVTGCESLTYSPDTKLCKFNGASWLYPTTTGCAVRVDYAGKQAPLIPVCQPGNTCTNPFNNIRLCNGSGSGVCDPSQGRVEVLYNNTWGTVCDDYWNDYDYTYEYSYYEYGVPNGDVICKTIGYSTGVPYTNATYGEGVGPILMDNVACLGTETSLFDCPFNGWNISNCMHYEDLGVWCTL